MDPTEKLLRDIFEDQVRLSDEIIAEVIAEENLPPIVSVWSSFGHRFISSDGTESCLTCGAVFELTRDEPITLAGVTAISVSGRYHAANGNDPSPCTGDTSMCHGEQPCEGEPGPGHDPTMGYIAPIVQCEDPTTCKHVKHACNCLLCA